MPIKQAFFDGLPYGRLYEKRVPLPKNAACGQFLPAQRRNSSNYRYLAAVISLPARAIFVHSSYMADCYTLQ